MLFEPKTVLRGAEIYLQKPSVLFETADKLFSLIDKNRKTLLPWIEMADAKKTSSREDAFLHLAKMAEKWQSQCGFVYLIYENENHHLIGMIEAEQSAPEHKKIEVGFWMCETENKADKICEALRLVEKEFFYLEFERIEIRLDSDNHKARKLAEACGYKAEGILRHAYWSQQFYKYRDLVILAKLKQEEKIKQKQPISLPRKSRLSVNGSNLFI